MVSAVKGKDLNVKLSQLSVMIVVIVVTVILLLYVKVDVYIPNMMFFYNVSAPAQEVSGYV